jgi:transposase-like protein
MTMNLLNFIHDYPDEDSCKLKYKELRDQVGIVCSKCGNKEHYWKRDKWQYECKKCGKRTTLRSGTVMHGSQLTFRYWFIVIHLLTSTRKSFSALELQRQLGHKRYEPIWEMLHKLREVMGKRDGEYELTNVIELDEGFFSTVVPEQEKGQPLKRGRGSQKKSKVLVMVESVPVEGKTTKKGKQRKVGHIKMIVIDDLKADTITSLVEDNVNKDTIIDSDNSTSYVQLKNIVKEHKPVIIPKEKVCEILPWVHLAISNAKRLLLDIHHDIEPQYLQSYLNEFCYKYNRRYFGEKLFDRLLIACVSYKNEF